MQAETASMSTLFDLTKEFGKCTIDRAGRVIDLGEEGAPETVEKEGAHWWRVPTKSARISFNVSFAEAKSTIDLIDLRYAQATAKRLEIRLNGKRVGMFELKEKSARVSATVRDAVLRPGKNEIDFHLGGVPKGSDGTHLLHGHGHFHRAGTVHLVAHDGFHLANHPQPHRHVAVDASAEFFD